MANIIKSKQSYKIYKWILINTNKDGLFFGLPTEIAKDTEVSRKTVERLLTKLTKYGYITKIGYCRYQINKEYYNENTPSL